MQMNDLIINDFEATRLLSMISIGGCFFREIDRHGCQFNRPIAVLCRSDESFKRILEMVSFDEIPVFRMDDTETIRETVKKYADNVIGILYTPSQKNSNTLREIGEEIPSGKVFGEMMKSALIVGFVGCIPCDIPDYFLCIDASDASIKPDTAEKFTQMKRLITEYASDKPERIEEAVKKICDEHSDDCPIDSWLHACIRLTCIMGNQGNDDLSEKQLTDYVQGIEERSDEIADSDALARFWANIFFTKIKGRVIPYLETYCQHDDNGNSIFQDNVCYYLPSNVMQYICSNEDLRKTATEQMYKAALVGCGALTTRKAGKQTDRFVAKVCVRDSDGKSLRVPFHVINKTVLQTLTNSNYIMEDEEYE